MSIWFAIAYMVLGILGVGLIGYTLADKIMKKEVGEDYMDKDREEECNRVMDDYDEHIDRIYELVPVQKRFFLFAMLWLSWPVSVPIWIHRIQSSDDIEEIIKHF